MQVHLCEVTMSTFYILPSRQLVEATFADYLKPLFPGLPWTATQSSKLTELLDSAVLLHPDVFVVYREELPEGDDLARALTDGFGAEPGDEVIEVRPGKARRDWTSRTWSVADAA
jgi:hypothetical protein